jgi:3-deoxy-7-phosphoheptulonate synthase
MVKTDNLNIERYTPLVSPDAVKAEWPLSEKAADTVVAARAGLENILSQRDSRFIMIVGPCSISRYDDALEFAHRLREMATAIADRILLLMRVYFEKPRTTLGWKGLLYDPHLNNSYEVETGLRLARRILLEINELGIPAATEILEPIIPQYITDLVSWAAIGARTTESQTHRQMASGLSMPIGFKNATDGSLKAAVDGIRTALSPHAFIGITGEGRIGVFRTRGNPFGHLILRGGNNGPNYASEHIAFAAELLRKSGIVPNLIVDCSHGNCGRDPKRQIDVQRDALAQLAAGNRTIKGTMLESNLECGRQDIPADPVMLTPGVSVTDPCLGWADTEALIRETHAQLGRIHR